MCSTHLLRLHSYPCQYQYLNDHSLCPRSLQSRHQMLRTLCLVVVSKRTSYQVAVVMHLECLRTHQMQTTRLQIQYLCHLQNLEVQRLCLCLQSLRSHLQIHRSLLLVAHLKRKNRQEAVKVYLEYRQTQPMHMTHLLKLSSNHCQYLYLNVDTLYPRSLQSHHQMHPTLLLVFQSKRISYPVAVVVHLEYFRTHQMQTTRLQVQYFCHLQNL
mmetsp:Transcript_22278/g.45176  ORF Transcript_22278/g.45176 Transcript_22278/m.45176 type:complete len:213 (+) Transcript_22278:558-1196(+)